MKIVVSKEEDRSQKPNPYLVSREPYLADKIEARRQNLIFRIILEHKITLSC